MKHETSWPEYANAQELLERHLVRIGNFTFCSVMCCLSRWPYSPKRALNKQKLMMIQCENCEFLFNSASSGHGNFPWRHFFRFYLFNGFCKLAPQRHLQNFRKVVQALCLNIWAWNLEDSQQFFLLGWFWFFLFVFFMFRPWILTNSS